jgi:predicted porin
MFQKFIVKLMAIFLLPSLAFSDGLNLRVGYTNETGTMSDSSESIDLSATGYQIAGSLDVTENVFLSLGYASGDATVTYNGASGKLDTTVTQLGVGYYLSNDLDELAGTGSSNGFGISMRSSEVSVGTVSQKSNSESLIYAAGFAISPGITTTISFSSPVNKIGADYSANLGLAYYFSEQTALTVSYGVSRADEDNIKTDISGFGIGISFLN